MVELNTERLKLIPLNLENLKLLIHNQREVEIKLSLNASDEFLNEELKLALKFRLSKVRENQQDYIWCTNWQIISRDKNCTVGGIMLKGRPNEDGEVIIGYYTLPQYQGKGYMTEAVNNIKSWLLNQPEVKFVIADTDKNNIASHRVLEKSGAEIYKETEYCYFWRFF
ncbi:N-acetyltransferase [Viridibacillus sp. FSL H7-0596]|uniref:GNAT family N-acetyltransferase n=1 Tax=Viridibacillus sp. FSL H7-0596 TaxID=1928923 RepID=UPI00096CF730|nr:GNAT family N-acetyltransferase [Viridibacillus sp. FSL H7-0596]OMC81896.1 N-acetyltransferase [Viridibacillus sp. FSL H7-0596]